MDKRTSKEDILKTALQPGTKTPSETRKFNQLLQAQLSDPENQEKKDALEAYEAELRNTLIERERQKRRDRGEKLECDAMDETKGLAGDEEMESNEVQDTEEETEIERLKRMLIDVERKERERERELEEKRNENELLRTQLQKRTQEVESLKTKVPRNILNSTAHNANILNNEPNILVIDRENLTLNYDVSNKVSESLNSLKNTLENNRNANAMNNLNSYTRKYTLSAKSDIIIWLYKLKSELEAKDLLDIIDQRVNEPENLNENLKAKRKLAVRNIITSHIDNQFYRQVLTLKEPREMLEKLRECVRVANNVTHTSVRTKLYQINMRKNENFGDFYKKFDNLITEYECCDKAIPLTDEEKRSALIQALDIAIPELTLHSIAYLQSNKRELTLAEIKSFALQLEAKRNATVPPADEKDKKVHVAQYRTKSTCNRCHRNGHWEPDCDLPEDKWYCYRCSKIHEKGLDCRMRKWYGQNNNENNNINDVDRGLRTFSDRWKEAKLVLIPKGKGDPGTPSAYRPIGRIVEFT
ncbi:leucine zipper protein 1-like [Phymastichus coffea]|uniref:leucine zipper protein 1-like n=1 Tax=Phymastichus coffea TaxID=108790 RepID=UPI00273B25E0|nr:leucine zipper protein 1-like [Phymastichus coffea]